MRNMRHNEFRVNPINNEFFILIFKECRILINEDKCGTPFYKLLIYNPMETELDTPFIHFSLQDGLLIATYKRRLKINLSIARQVVKSRLSFTGNRLIPVLILSEGQVTMDKEARDFLASSEGTKGLSAAAMVLKNSFDWALGSFFLHLRKPAMPTRVFTRYDSAIKWLRNFVT